MKKLLLETILIFFLLCSCNQVNIKKPINTESALSNSTDSSQTDGCIAPLTNFAYPVGGDVIDLPAPADQVIMLPPSSWKLVSTLPIDTITEYGNNFGSGTIRKNGDHEEFWVIPEGYLGIDILNLETKVWRHIEEKNDFVKNSFLFLDQDNSIWAAKGLSGNSPLLLHFNDQSSQFETISDQDGLLNNSSQNNNIASLKIDPSGIFWMVVQNNDLANDPHAYILYSFNPRTLKAKKHNISIDFDGDLAIGKNNTIYLLNAQKGIVTAYDSQKNAVITYEIGTKLDASEDFDLFYDSTDRLWVSDIGWFDFSKEYDYPHWYEIVRSSSFLMYIYSSAIWRWGNPSFTNQTSDGLLWFIFPNGTGWLDPSKGKWCIFTSYSSKVMEDNDHNLWIFVNHSLYEKMSK